MLSAVIGDPVGQNLAGALGAADADAGGPGSVAATPSLLVRLRAFRVASRLPDQAEVMRRAAAGETGHRVNGRSRNWAPLPTADAACRPGPVSRAGGRLTAAATVLLALT